MSSYCTVKESEDAILHIYLGASPTESSEPFLWVDLQCSVSSMGLTPESVYHALLLESKLHWTQCKSLLRKHLPDWPQSIFTVPRTNRPNYFGSAKYQNTKTVCIFFLQTISQFIMDGTFNMMKRGFQAQIPASLFPIANVNIFGNKIINNSA